MTDSNWHPDTDHPPGGLQPLVGLEAEQALRAMGTSAAQLWHPAFRGYLIRRDFSHRHYPPTTPGYNQWASANKLLRDLHVPLGWEARDDQGVPKTVAPGGAFAITILGGNEDTGLAHREPSTRRPRGSQGKVDVRNNAQGDLFGYTPPAPTEKTYYLLVHAVEDREPVVLRAELSLPWELNGQGEVVRWHRRIILPEIDLDGGPPTIEIQDDAPNPEVDIAIRRRQA